MTARLVAGLSGVLHTELEARLRRLIAAGQLRPGAELPGSRWLAGEIGVSRVTVTTAYDQLVAEGYLQAEPRRPTRVATGLPATGFAMEAGLQPDRSKFPMANPWAGTAPVTMDVTPVDEEIDLGPESFALRALDIDRWGRRLVAAWREVAAEPDGPAVSYFGGLGDPILRRALAAHLTVQRGVRARPESVAITPGATAALSAIARAWLGPGRTCVVEDPGGAQLRRSLASAGATLVPVPVDEDGLVVAALPSRADVVFVTPSWQYPGGGRMPLRRRVALLDWARAGECLIVEDDCEGELRHAGDPLPTLQGLGEDGRVIYVNTFSKVLFPGLRTGYVVVPDLHRGLLLAALEAGARPPSAVEQRALGRFVESGAYVRHLRRVRSALASGRRAFEGALRECAPATVSIRAGEAGGHLVVELPPGVAATQVAASLRKVRVRAEPLSANAIDTPASDGALVVYLTRARESELVEAARRLGALLRT